MIRFYPKTTEYDLAVRSVLVQYTHLPHNLKDVIHTKLRTKFANKRRKKNTPEIKRKKNHLQSEKK